MKAFLITLAVVFFGSLFAQAMSGFMSGLFDIEYSISIFEIIAAWLLL